MILGGAKACMWASVDEVPTLPRPVCASSHSTQPLYYALKHEHHLKEIHSRSNPVMSKFQA